MTKLDFKPTIRREYGWWTCGWETAQACSRYPGASPQDAYKSWMLSFNSSLKQPHKKHAAMSPTEDDIKRLRRGDWFVVEVTLDKYYPTHEDDIGPFIIMKNPPLRAHKPLYTNKGGYWMKYHGTLLVIETYETHPTLIAAIDPFDNKVKHVPIDKIIHIGGNPP